MKIQVHDMIRESGQIRQPATLGERSQRASVVCWRPGRTAMKARPVDHALDRAVRGWFAEVSVFPKGRDANWEADSWPAWSEMC